MSCSKYNYNQRISVNRIKLRTMLIQNEFILVFSFVAFALCTSLEEEDSDLVSDFRCDYCKLKPFDGRPNTYCKFKSYLKKPHSRCTKDFKFGISKKDEREILKAHNDYRRKVASGSEPRLKRKQAADMMELTWDDELARGAQMWANQCLFDHDGRRTCKFNWIGQNSFRSSFKEKPSQRRERWEGFVDSWYAEVDTFARKRQPTSKYQWDAATGHFTQVIWASTTKIGCGYIAHKGNGAWGNKGLLICNYGNGGNIPGKPIFTTGKAGSKCPRGSYNFRGLCRTKRREYEHEQLDENNQGLEESNEELGEQKEAEKND